MTLEMLSHWYPLQGAYCQYILLVHEFLICCENALHEITWPVLVVPLCHMIFLWLILSLPCSIGGKTKPFLCCQKYYACPIAVFLDIVFGSTGNWTKTGILEHKILGHKYHTAFTWGKHFWYYTMRTSIWAVRLVHCRCFLTKNHPIRQEEDINNIKLHKWFTK